MSGMKHDISLVDLEPPQQAAEVVTASLRTAIDSIDSVLGAGYARNHPVLLGAFLRTCAAYIKAGAISAQTQRIGPTLDEIRRSIDSFYVGGP
jgi:hypothetical protein